MIEKIVEIRNRKGMHGRASSALVATANLFESEIILGIHKRKKERPHNYTNMTANARSMMAVLLLAADTGDFLTVTTDGPDEEEAMAAVIEFIENRED